MGPLGAMQAGQGTQYLIHNPMFISNGTRERRQGGDDERADVNSAARWRWDGPRQPVHTRPQATCKGWSSEFRDLWWDILNPSTWLLGLPSVGRYAAAAGTRPQGQTIYVNHFARALWVRPWYVLPHQAKSAHCTEVPSLPRSRPGVASLMVAGIPDKIRRPDQTLLAECSRVCRRGSEGQRGAGTAGTADRADMQRTRNHTADQSLTPVALFGYVLFLFQTFKPSSPSLTQFCTTVSLPALFPSDE